MSRDRHLRVKWTGSFPPIAFAAAVVSRGLNPVRLLCAVAPAVDRLEWLSGVGSGLTACKRVPVETRHSQYSSFRGIVVVTTHALFVIGGEDDETISVVQTEVGRSCRLVCTVRGETHSAEEADFFEALRTIRRRALEPLGLIPFCYGASLKVWPSGMARDMGQGLKAYKIESGVQASELVGIFDSGADVIPAKVDSQESYARDWIASLRSPSTEPPSPLRSFWQRLRNAIGTGSPV